ncbi:MAG: hypothetical protein ACI8Y7_001023 [Candidatus Woesearchaeota archaeon]|jgi:uncharacterized protein (UPF0332 family)
MNERREKQAKLNFDNYLRDNLLRKEKINKNILKKLIQNSIESLTTAKVLHEQHISLLWVVVTSYYSMFYIASAYVYNRGYKAQHRIVHKVINDALIVLAKKELENKYLQEYEEEKEQALAIAQSTLESIEHERVKRSTFQYEMSEELKKVKAKTSLNRAKEFVSVFRELLE